MGNKIGRSGGREGAGEVLQRGKKELQKGGNFRGKRGNHEGTFAEYYPPENEGDRGLSTFQDGCSAWRESREQELRAKAMLSIKKSE